ncbi:hypothetical protein SDC9_206458 [bioreactor metagenome]|uniref:Uncharacterized protein n=1 Tax=bioreactor metagenome TaxID=1076179 RepID=A0A645J4W0_9ZZZZ
MFAHRTGVVKDKIRCFDILGERISHGFKQTLDGLTVSHIALATESSHERRWTIRGKSGRQIRRYHLRVVPLLVQFFLRYTGCYYFFIRGQRHTSGESMFLLKYYTHKPTTAQGVRVIAGELAKFQT